MNLRVKESEIKCLKQEISSLKFELQAANMVTHFKMKYNVSVREALSILTFFSVLKIFFSILKSYSQSCVL